MNNREIEQTRFQMCAEHGSCNPKCSLWVLREHGKTCTWSVFAHIGWAEQKMKEWRAKHEESVGS